MGDPQSKCYLTRGSAAKGFCSLGGAESAGLGLSDKTSDTRWRGLSCRGLPRPRARGQGGRKALPSREFCCGHLFRQEVDSPVTPTRA